MPYKFDVTILADRGFKSVDLFEFIDKTLEWKYCIRCTKDLLIFIDGKNKIKKLDDIIQSTDIHYAKMLYFCVCIAYTYIISLGASCSKDKKNNLLGATKNINGKKVRIYSLFTTGIKWFKRDYYSCRKKYYLKTCFTIYQR